MARIGGRFKCNAKWWMRECLNMPPPPVLCYDFAPVPDCVWLRALASGKPMMVATPDGENFTAVPSFNAFSNPSFDFSADSLDFCNPNVQLAGQGWSPGWQEDETRQPRIWQIKISKKFYFGIRRKKRKARGSQDDSWKAEIRKGGKRENQLHPRFWRRVRVVWDKYLQRLSFFSVFHVGNLARKNSLFEMIRFAQVLPMESAVLY